MPTSSVCNEPRRAQSVPPAPKPTINALDPMPFESCRHHKHEIKTPCSETSG